MIKPWIEQGVHFKREKVTPENLAALLSRYVAPGDLIIDLAWNIDCCELLQWCREHGVLYINTSVEVWDPYEGLEWKRPTERTLYFRHMNIRHLKAEWHDPGATAVLEHVANPGLISHWVKKGLLDIAAALVAERKLKPADAEEVQHLASARIFNRLAQNRRQGDPLQRTRYANREPAEGNRRIREHLEHRGLPRRRHLDRGNGLGNA